MTKKQLLTEIKKITAFNIYELWQDGKKENAKLKELLREVESQLNDRGGFDILRASINETLKKQV